MAKNNFKAKEATGDANYAQGVGTGGQGLMQTGVGQQAQGFQGLQDTLGQQKSFSDMLQAAAAGTGGPTLADQQIKDATSRNNANAAGFAAGAKGLSPALAARQALMAQSGNNQQAAGQAAQTRIQEQQAARAQLGGALQGQASTAGGMTAAGLGAAGTGGGLANQSNANLNTSRQSANQINADVAKQNASSVNGMIGGVMNAAGAAFGLAEGGVVPGEPEGTQSDETSIALAKGGMVPQGNQLPSTSHGLAQPHRSFAAQVAHHLSREYFAEGGMAEQPGAHDSLPKKKKHGSYDFPPMSVDSPEAEPTASKEGTDSEGKEKKLRLADGGAVKKPKVQYVPHNTLDVSPTSGNTAAQPGVEGTDSEGKKKSLRLAEGGFADADDDSPRPDAADEDDEDNQPDTDELELPGMYAEGGEASDESAGLNMAAIPPAAPAHPSIFQQMGQRISQKFQASPIGGLISGRTSFDAGGPVPGQAKVAGNSLKNDVVPAQLSPGEVVLPRTIAHDPEKAKAFVEHLLAHGGSGHAALKDIKKRKS